jgi:hypothetical protein
MPYVPPAEVARVTDERLCERAARALAAQFFRRGPRGAPHLEPVALFRAGPRHIAVPRDARMGEWGYAVHLDSATFRTLAVGTF